MESRTQQQALHSAHSVCPTCPSSKAGSEAKVEESSIGGRKESTTGVGGEVGLGDTIKQEHRCIQELYSSFKSSSDNHTKLCQGRRLIECISKHAGREEIALYPAYRDIPALGENEVSKSTQEHQACVNELYKLNKMTEVNAEYDQLLGKVMADLNRHITDEETRILPIFCRDCPKERCAQVLHNYKNAIVTDQPHPSAPREGLAAAAAHMAAVPIDAVSKAMRSE